MKIIEVVKSGSVRVNLGDYQSVEFFASFKAECKDTIEDLARTEESLDLLIASNLTRTLVNHYHRRGKKITAEQVAKQYGLNMKKPGEDFG